MSVEYSFLIPIVQKCYENRLRDATVIVENKVALFFPTRCRSFCRWSSQPHYLTFTSKNKPNYDVQLPQNIQTAIEESNNTSNFSLMQLKRSLRASYDIRYSASQQ